MITNRHSTGTLSDNSHIVWISTKTFDIISCPPTLHQKESNIRCSEVLKFRKLEIGEKLLRIIQLRETYENSSSMENSDRARDGTWKGRSLPLKPTKVTLFTMIFCNSKNNVPDIRSFCRSLFYHSSVVKCTSSLL